MTQQPQQEQYTNGYQPTVGGPQKPPQLLQAPAAPKLSDTVRNLGAATGNKFIAGAANVAANVGKGLFSGGVTTNKTQQPPANAPTAVLNRLGNMGKIASAKMTAVACYNLVK